MCGGYIINMWILGPQPRGSQRFHALQHLGIDHVAGHFIEIAPVVTCSLDIVNTESEKR